MGASSAALSLPLDASLHPPSPSHPPPAGLFLPGLPHWTKRSLPRSLRISRSLLSFQESALLEHRQESALLQGRVGRVDEENEGGNLSWNGESNMGSSGERNGGSTAERNEQRSVRVKSSLLSAAAAAVAAPVSPGESIRAAVAVYSASREFWWPPSTPKPVKQAKLCLPRYSPPVPLIGLEKLMEGGTEASGTGAGGTGGFAGPARCACRRVAPVVPSRPVAPVVPSPLPSRRPCCPVPSRRPCCPVAPAVPSRCPCRRVAPAVPSHPVAPAVPLPLLSRPVAPAVVSPLLSRPVPSPLLSRRVAPCCPFCPAASRRPSRPVPPASRFPSCPVARAPCALPVRRAPCALPVRRAPRALPVHRTPAAPCSSVAPPLCPARPSHPVRPARPHLSCPSLPVASCLVASHCLSRTTQAL
ncbi:unnamed protein product [Closterium sp. Naga37s-1]|nr:unnamed protein product [Closterium sp. Naga37s-1]